MQLRAMARPVAKVVARSGRAFSVRHLMDGEYGLPIADTGIVLGRIGWDEAHDGRLPEPGLF